MWLIAHFAMLWGRFPIVDLVVQQSVAYGVLGGLWYAGMLFLFWMQGAQPGRQEVRRRTLMIAFGSLVAALLTVIAARAVLWAPPSAHPELAGLYPENFPLNLNATSFPSQSTALYAAVTAGIYSLRGTLGMWAWMGVGMFVALPRMYLGGHYLTDILAGLVAGLGGYWVATLLEARAMGWCQTAFEYQWGHWQRTLAECAVFLWLLQVATEFRHAVWITNVLAQLWQ
jgi:membrane-associated phospholipid phosphatase